MDQILCRQKVTYVPLNQQNQVLAKNLDHNQNILTLYSVSPFKVKKTEGEKAIVLSISRSNSEVIPSIQQPLPTLHSLQNGWEAK